MTSNKKHAGLVRRHGGFTLIETLVAVLVLAMAIAGPLTIASKGLNSALIAKDQTTAYNLGQDAIEYVRFVRDSNRLAGNTDWLAGLDGAATNTHTNNGGLGVNCANYPGASASPSACAVDAVRDTTNNNNCANIAANGLPLCSTPLLYDSVTGQYGTTATANTTPTIFTRTVLIECLASSAVTANCSIANEAIVRVTVQWNDVGGTTRQIVVSENLFSWQ